MIQLFFLVLFVKGVVAFLLLVKIGPLRELVIKSLDQLKMGKGPATMKTIAGTMLVILLSSLLSIIKIQNKGAKLLGGLEPLSTPKASSRSEAFPHTYKLTTNPFHNRCGTTPTISHSHIGPWVRAETTRFSRIL
jgi:hypothetical protein